MVPALAFPFVYTRPSLERLDLSGWMWFRAISPTKVASYVFIGLEKLSLNLTIVNNILSFAWINDGIGWDHQDETGSFYMPKYHQRTRILVASVHFFYLQTRLRRSLKMVHPTKVAGSDECISCRSTVDLSLILTLKPTQKGVDIILRRVQTKQKLPPPIRYLPHLFRPICRGKII